MELTREALLGTLSVEHVPTHVREALIAVGSPVVPVLIGILDDESLDDGEASLAPLHAAKLLGEMRATEATAPLLRALARVDADDLLYSEALHALIRIGPSVLEPTLAALEHSTREDTRAACLEVLARVGVKDDRVYDALLRYAQVEPGLAASFLGSYGDVRALPRLSELINWFDIDAAIRDPLRFIPFFDMAEAVEELGGTLTEAQAKKLEMARTLSAALRDADKPRDRPSGSNGDRKRKKAERKAKKKAQRRNRR